MPWVPPPAAAPASARGTVPAVPRLALELTKSLVPHYGALATVRRPDGALPGGAPDVVRADEYEWHNKSVPRFPSSAPAITVRHLPDDAGAAPAPPLGGSARPVAPGTSGAPPPPPPAAAPTSLLHSLYRHR